jgi:hypothetical protein
MPIVRDTQRIIEDELENEQKNPTKMKFNYKQKKIGKFDSSKGSEAEQ